MDRFTPGELVDYIRAHNKKTKQVGRSGNVDELMRRLDARDT